jgi:DNA polymerase III epsilon subunit-like protein
MILVFDTETNGLPKNWKAPVTDLDNWPRIIQLAFATFSDEGEFIDSYCELIVPDGWEVPTDKFWVDNGYSQDSLIMFGVPIKDAMTTLLISMQNCHTIVAHNMSFDEKIVGAEMLRLGFKSENKPTKVCTKESSTEYCAIPNQNGFNSFKWPKLEELHNKLFGEGFEGAHDALNDVMACAKCYFELKKLEIIK